MAKTFAGAAFAAGAMLIALAACSPDAAEDITEDSGAAPAAAEQARAEAMFEALCDTRGFDGAKCACMRERISPVGPGGMAFVAASYGGDLTAAAAVAGTLEDAKRTAAIQAYFIAESECRDAAAGAGTAAVAVTGAGMGARATTVAATGDDADGPATLDDVRASCRPAMAEVCACRARSLAQTLGDGAYEAAIAINTGARARLESLAAGREPGWAARAADAYARTSAPCVVQAGR